MKKGMMIHSSLIVAVWMIFAGCAPQPAPTHSKTCIDSVQLSAKSYDHLALVAKQLRDDQKNVETFEGFINIMKGSVDDYATMVKSSVYISNVVRFLPVPYAGEVSNTTKLISKTVLNLGGAASVLDRYKKSSLYFLENFDKINRANANPSDLVKLAQYADTKLISDASDLQNALQAISESAAIMSATTQSIADALDTASGYMNQAKSLVGMTQPSSEDKNQVIQNRNSINARMGQLNQKIVALEKSAQAYRPNIAKGRIYAELAQKLEMQQ